LPLNLIIPIASVSQKTQDFGLPCNTYDIPPANRKFVVKADFKDQWKKGLVKPSMGKIRCYTDGLRIVKMAGNKRLTTIVFKVARKKKTRTPICQSFNFGLLATLIVFIQKSFPLSLVSAAIYLFTSQGKRISLLPNGKAYREVRLPTSSVGNKRKETNIRKLFENLKY